MKCISSRFYLPDCAKAEELKVRCPEELLVVPRIDQLLLNIANGAFYVANKFTPVPTLQLSDLSLVIEDRVLEDLLDVLVADLGWLFSR